MDESEKKKLSENDIGDIFTSSSIRDAVWYLVTQIRRALTLMHAPVVVRCNLSYRNKKEIADSLLPRGPSVSLARQPQGQKYVFLYREAVLANIPAQHILQETR